MPTDVTIAPDIVIEARGVSKRFGRTLALDSVDLEIRRGSMYALLGPNGAGKTTLLKILTGLTRPTSGTSLLEGQPVHQLTSADRARIRYVAEGQELPGWMTVQKLERYLAPMYSTWDFSLAEELRDRFRLPTKTRIRKLSRGEQMKAALLVALASRPSVLILDEPFTGMDALVKDELIYGLLELAQGDDWTLLLCSHDIGHLEGLADWVGFLDRGKLILSEPQEVLKGRFRRIDLQLSNGALTELNSLPPTWLSPQRAGQRLTFVSCDHGSDAWESEIRASIPGLSSVEIEEASLREIFVALAAEGLGGRDWENEGGLR